MKMDWKETKCKSYYEVWKLINDDLIEFSNKATLKQFEFLFENDAKRLFDHFKYDCYSNMQKFYTYLTIEQYNTLIANVHENKISLYTL